MASQSGKPGDAGPTSAPPTSSNSPAFTYRMKSPPRTLPGPLDMSSLGFFDSKLPPVPPFSPTSPTGRPKTMKDYEEELGQLKREHFHLKLRFYFLQKQNDLPADVTALQSNYVELEKEFKQQKTDLEEKEGLLVQAYKAMDLQKKQIETMMEEHQAKEQELLSRIEVLEKELKDYQIRFMETSVQMDDTNAMYALTFGLHCDKLSEPNRVDIMPEGKIKELEAALEEEKKQVLHLESVISEMSSKSGEDQAKCSQLQEQIASLEDRLGQVIKEKSLHEEALKEERKQVLHLEGVISEMSCKSGGNQSKCSQLQEQIASLEDRLGQVVKEKSLREEALKEAASQTKALLKSIKKFQDTIIQKDTEIGSLKALLIDSEQRLAATNKKLQDKEQTGAEASRKLQKQVEDLATDNKHLNNKVRVLQQQLTQKSPPREQESRNSTAEEQAQYKVRALQQEIQELRNSRPQYPGGIETFVQALIIDNKQLKKELQELKTAFCELYESKEGSSKDEGPVSVAQSLDATFTKAMSKDGEIAELKCKIQELNEVISRNEQLLPGGIIEELQNKHEQEKEVLVKELEEKKKEVDGLEKKLKKKDYNLQGLVNTELWDKNREIEKLNKVCERQHVELLSLQKQLRDYSLTLMQNNVNSFVPPLSLGSGIFCEDKENMLPSSEPMRQLQALNEEKRMLVRKVEELEARLLNTPERDSESSLVQNLRTERDQAEKMRKETMNACVLLTNRLQELADFLDSLLPSLCGKKRRVVKQAVERSRELSRSLSLAAEESTMQSLHCSAWTDLQPSLYLPLLPDVSTVEFWSGENSQEEIFSEGEEDNLLKSQAETPIDHSSQNQEIVKNSAYLKSVLSFDDQQLLGDRNVLLSDISFPGISVDFTESSVVETCDNNKARSLRQSPEVKSANIGKITLTSRKKEQKSTNTVGAEEPHRPGKKEGELSENETWSEPDRDVSYARMGIKEESTNVNKSVMYFDETSETADSSSKTPSSRRASEISRLQRKIRSLEQVNEALRSELLIYHKLAPPSSTRQDKATSIEMSRQNALCIPAHLLEEIKHQREKLEASLFHNDYIRRQLETTVSSLRKSQGDDPEKSSLIVRLKEVTNQLELRECEVAKFRTEKESWTRKAEMLQKTLEQSSSDLVEKQCALKEGERRAEQKLKEVEQKCLQAELKLKEAEQKCLQAEMKLEEAEQKCVQTQLKCKEVEQKWLELQKERDQLLGKLAVGEQEVGVLKAEIQRNEEASKKNKQLIEELNVKLQQVFQQKEDLQRVVADQDQLLADAERERQELATQLIARDRQVSDLQKRLSHMELTSGELEAALKAQLDLATQQCDQYKAKIRDLDDCTKRRDEGVIAELTSRLDAARYAHSEAFLQYTRVANENIRLQQELRRRQLEPNEQVERIRGELERRVAELEAVNAELEARLRRLDMKPSCSDYDTDTGSCTVGSPQRPQALVLHSYSTQRSQDLTSDYLSDQERALPSPQTQTRSMWFPPSPQSHISQSPDLGIESDQGRFSSLETHASKSTAVSLRGAPVSDLTKLEEENTQLRRNLQKTRHALEETLAQLTAANQHKRHFEEQLSAASQQKAKVERAICRQINKTQSILKKAKVNLEEDYKSKNH